MKKDTLIKLITSVLFFIIGLLISFLWRNYKQTQLESSSISPAVAAEEGKLAENKAEEETEWKEIQPLGDSFNQPVTTSQGKFTIVETKKMTVDKIQAETGETVTFSTQIKNQGTKRKHLTHVCFNHSGGTTFGCLNGPQGPNLDPGEEISIGNTMIFSSPGTYFVWLTWSQDETNFYRPVNGSSVKIVIE